jgi:hypothetical protein
MFTGAERFFNDFADLPFAGLPRVVAFDFGKLHSLELMFDGCAEYWRPPAIRATATKLKASFVQRVPHK